MAQMDWLIGYVVSRLLANGVVFSILPAMELTRRELYEMVWREPVCAVAARLKISSSDLAKLCDRLDVPRPSAADLAEASEHRHVRVPLPPAPAGVPETVRLDALRESRPRTRLNLATRRDQLIDAAAGIALESGLTGLTIKRVANAVGISEAQVHNYFGGRHDLLVALARREIAAISEHRSMLLARGSSRRTRIVISTMSYLHEAAKHGPLLQRLLRDPEVRRALRDEWEARTSHAFDPIVRNLTEGGGLDTQEALASTAALTAISLRAGGIVAARRAPFEIVERLCIAMMMAGIESDAKLIGSLRQTTRARIDHAAAAEPVR
jgi:AcrR family transcriptional regulator